MPRLRLPLAALALALALPGWWIDARVFFACWLVAWWFGLGLVLGGLTNIWIHRLSGGRWGEALRPPVQWTARRMPWVIVLFLPLAAGLGLLYPWARGDAAWTAGLARPAFVTAWLEPTAFWIRMALYALAWWWMARPSVPQRKGRVAGALALHVVLSSLASVDLLMSLVPGWFSTAFGLVVLSGQATGATALSVLRLAHAAADPKPPWRDLGNLMLMWVMVWAYVAFMEFLIIWAENLPREIAFFVPRLQTGWVWVSLALALVMFVLPTLALLWRAIKDDPRRLRGVAAVVLAMQLVNTAWLVLPSVAPHSLLGWWLVPLLALAMGLALFGGPAAEPARLSGAGHAHP
ncbi:MAG: hypothetical protein JNL85_03995 [Rubrivivax sp.]|nr:hypothetical protein [Rubrivivax sp.]